MTGFLEEAFKYVIGGLVGGMFTGGGSFILFNTRLTRLSTKVETMEKNCDGCKTGTATTLELINRDLGNHRADDERHNSMASHQMLLDILSRVMRIETRLFKGDL